MKRVILITTSMAAAAILLVVLLFQISNKASKLKNGFVRKFKPDAARLRKMYDLGYNSFYIAGLTSDHIFLGNYKATSVLMQTDFYFEYFKQISVLKDNKERIRWPKVSVVVDSPVFYLTEGVTPTILHGAFNAKSNNKYSFDSLHFSLVLPVADNSYILRAFDNSHNQFQLAKTTGGLLSVKNNPALLEKQSDGIFDIDGMLSYERVRQQLVYVYFYRNQFILLDTNLRIQYRANTIDTCARVKINTTTIRSDNKMVLSAPPVIVNKQSCLSGNFIFIRSALKADNEDIHLFNSSSVIDVYATINGKYLYSFYLPDVENNKVSAFRVVNDKLIAIYNKFICTYALTQDQVNL